jgi:hypothetical protein
MTSSSSGAAESAITVRVQGDTGIPVQLLQQVNAAVHRAVLSELAVADLGPGFRVSDLDPAGGAVGTTAVPETDPLGDVHYGIFIQINF